MCELPQQIEVTLKDWVHFVEASTSPMLLVGIPMCILDHSHSTTASPPRAQISRWTRIEGAALQVYAASGSEGARMCLRPTLIYLSSLQLALSCLVTARAELPLVSNISLSVYESVSVRNASVEGPYVADGITGMGESKPSRFLMTNMSRVSFTPPASPTAPCYRYTRNTAKNAIVR